MPLITYLFLVLAHIIGRPGQMDKTARREEVGQSGIALQQPQIGQGAQRGYSQQNALHTHVRAPSSSQSVEGKKSPISLLALAVMAAQGGDECRLQIMRPNTRKALDAWSLLFLAAACQSGRKAAIKGAPHSRQFWLLSARICIWHGGQLAILVQQCWLNGFSRIFG